MQESIASLLLSYLFMLANVQKHEIINLFYINESERSGAVQIWRETGSRRRNNGNALLCPPDLRVREFNYISRIAGIFVYTLMLG